MYFNVERIANGNGEGKHTECFSFIPNSMQTIMMEKNFENQFYVESITKKMFYNQKKQTNCSLTAQIIRQYQTNSQIVRTEKRPKLFSYSNIRRKLQHH
jgi:hypothetical protein